MGKKRKQKCTVYGVVEDQIEFIEFLKETYESDENNVNVYIKDANGGTPDRILEFAIRECNRERSFVWLDEDFEPNQTLGKEVRKKLAKYWGVNENLDEFLKCPLADLQKNYNKGNKKPVLIVSKPVCSEAIVIQVLGEDVPDSCKIYDPKKRKVQINSLKHKLKSIFGENKEMDFYQKNLSRDILEERRIKIAELDMLISMITR